MSISVFIITLCAEKVPSSIVDEVDQIFSVWSIHSLIKKSNILFVTLQAVGTCKERNLSFQNTLLQNGCKTEYVPIGEYVEIEFIPMYNAAIMFNNEG